nr:EOG090X0CGF [Ilyocryptus agilis]
MNERTFDANFVKACIVCRNYSMGRMYISLLQEKGSGPNVATLVKFIQLCYYCRQQVDKIDEVEQFCNQLQSHSPFLDSNSKESLVLGLSITSKWKDGLKLLLEDESIQANAPMNAMIDRLLAEDDLESATFLMEKAAEKKRTIYDFVHEHWINKSEKNPHAWDLYSSYISRNEVFLKEVIAFKLKDMLARRSFDSYIGQKTTVADSNGKCRSCNEILQNTSISEEEYSALKTCLLEKVLQGPDVFVGSRPEELTRFREFINETAPYDVVIDGLNVAYFHGTDSQRNPPKKRMQSLLSVVKHFNSQGKKVFVLGRDHMRYWSPQLCLFLTENLSKDDPFLLYAALQSADTKIVSDDIFRDHLFRLGDSRLANVFRLWQRSSQLQIIAVGDGLVQIHYPLKHRTVAQYNNNGCWHIPYDDGVLRFSYQLPTTWLCLQPNDKPINSR